MYINPLESNSNDDLEMSDEDEEISFDEVEGELIHNLIDWVDRLGTEQDIGQPGICHSASV